MKSELKEYIENYKDHIYGFKDYTPWYGNDAPLWEKKLYCCAQELDKHLGRYTYTGAIGEAREIAIPLHWNKDTGYSMEENKNLFGEQAYSIIKKWGLEFVALWTYGSNSVLLIFGIPKRTRKNAISR